MYRPQSRDDQRRYQERWQTNYRQRYDQQQRLAQQRALSLQQQRRISQYRFQQDYWERVRRDQQRLQNWRINDNLNYNYRYSRGGSYYYTSNQGAQMLRNAMQNGYEAGYQAGRADRQDGWGYEYQNSYGYQDANYGYDSYYVDSSEYNHYFREGFRRGYDDGYYSRSQYGNNYNGKYTILGAVIGAVLDLIF